MSSELFNIAADIINICTHAKRRRQRWGALTYCEQVKYRTQVLYETQAGVQAGGQLRRTREGTRPRTLEVEKNKNNFIYN